MACRRKASANDALTATGMAATLAQWLAESPKVLVGAGAGLSVAAGIDYTDEDDFALRFPALVRHGLRARYQLIGYDGLSEGAFWGWWASHVQQIRFGLNQAAVYGQLFALLQQKDYFVLTSNVDAMFVRHGFESSRVCSIQGDYAYMQCMRPCRPQVWSSREAVDRLVAVTDPMTQEITDLNLIPRCPHCGGKVFLNVRAGSWFVDTPYLTAFADLNTWLRDEGKSPLLVVDVGSGFNTPSVVRWPMEQVAAHIRTARLARINPAHPEVPAALGDRALAIDQGAAETISAVYDSLRG